MSQDTGTTQQDHSPRVQAAGRTHRGLVRNGNEDNFVCADRVWAVADGVGGHPAGEVASQLALQPLAELDGRDDDGDLASALAEAVHEANRIIFADAEANPERTGMATTLTAAALTEEGLHLAHVGDSRGYLLRRHEGLQRLTRDHTQVEEAMAAGVLTPEQAAVHPARHMLTRIVGDESEIEVDTMTVDDLGAGDRLLLCTDGLTEAVDEPMIARRLGDCTDPGDCADTLVQAALERGAPDNVTVVVVLFD